MSGGKGTRGKATATAASPMEKTRRQAKSTILSPPSSPTLREPSSDTETGPTPDTQMGGEATMMDIWLDLHSRLDVLQKDLENLKASSGRAPEMTTRQGMREPGTITGRSSTRH